MVEGNCAKPGVLPWILVTQCAAQAAPTVTIWISMSITTLKKLCFVGITSHKSILGNSTAVMMRQLCHLAIVSDLLVLVTVMKLRVRTMNKGSKAKMARYTDPVELARELAYACHAGQFDKLGEPYILHVESVVKSVTHLGPEYETVAWLHDSIEDTDVSLDDIEKQFGPQVSGHVDAITKRKNEDYFGSYINRLKSSQVAVQVKIADSSHNLERLLLLQAIDPLKAKTLEEKYRLVLTILNRALSVKGVS